MSYIKITQLPTATGVTPNDYLVIVDEPGSCGVTKKITAEDLAETLITIIDGGEVT